MIAKLYVIHALSPIHCGTGQGAGGIDLPIARERSTGIPYVPGSSIKGVVRSLDDESAPLHRIAFGSRPNDELAAGHVQLSDATLTFLPVRSARSTFAWATSPYLLARLARDAKEAGIDLGKLPAAPKGESHALVTSKRLQINNKLVLEDVDPSAEESPELTALARKVSGWLFEEEAQRSLFVERVALVDEDVMALLLHAGLEITTRNRINPETRVVERGALWTEEALPIESVLTGLILASPVGRGQPGADAALEHVKGLMTRGALQLGGKASVGRGFCRVGVV